MLLFNPPYVPTPSAEVHAGCVPMCACACARAGVRVPVRACRCARAGTHKHACTPCSGLAAAWAGGVDGREVTDRVLPLLPRLLARPHGAAYVLLLEENRPADVVAVCAAAGLTATRVVSRRAKNELLHVYRFGWPPL